MTQGLRVNLCTSVLLYTLSHALVAAEDTALLNIVLDVDVLYTPLSSEAVYGTTAAELVKELEQKHYSTVVVDDNFSVRLFDAYIDALDNSRLYFLHEDLERLKPLKYTLDDSLNSGSVEPGFEIYNIYQQRLLERLVYTIAIVEDPASTMDFTLDEFIEIDREESPFVTTVAELNDLWRLRVKNAALSLKLAGDDMEEIRDKLSRRYRNQLNQILKTNDRDVFQVYLATVASIVDPHTSYFSPRDSENFNMGLSLSLQGIGAQLTTEDEYTKVLELIKGGPAERGAELKAGDKIIGIGQGPDGEIKDVVGMRLDDVVSQIRGEKDTVVRLHVIPAEAVSEISSKTITITRDTVKLEDQSAKKEIIELSYNSRDYRIGVIHLPTFYFDFEAASRGEADFKSSTNDVKDLLEELKIEGIDAVVVDLRNNGGGSLSEVNQLVGLFIDTGPTVQIRYSGLRNGFTRAFGDDDPGVVYDGPLAVLVNRTSASASEIFAGAIQDYQRGIVLGGQTFGKGTVQEIIPMNYGQVKLTRSKFYRISGASTQNRGVIPDIAFPDVFQSYKDFGESSLEGSLPWDTVRPVEYNAYYPIKELLPELESLHAQRVAESPDFIYLNDQIERSSIFRERTSHSLNEAVVKAERDESRRTEFDANNMRLMLKGLPLIEWVDEEADDSDAEIAEISALESTEQNLAELAAEQEEEEEVDPLLLESGKILADFIALSDRQLTARAVPRERLLN